MLKIVSKDEKKRWKPIDFQFSFRVAYTFNFHSTTFNGILTLRIDICNYIKLYFSLFVCIPIYPWYSNVYRGRNIYVPAHGLLQLFRSVYTWIQVRLYLDTGQFIPGYRSVYTCIQVSLFLNKKPQVS